MTPSPKAVQAQGFRRFRANILKDGQEDRCARETGQDEGMRNCKRQPAA